MVQHLPAHNLSTWVRPVCSLWPCQSGKCWALCMVHLPELSLKKKEEYHPVVKKTSIYRHCSKGVWKQVAYQSYQCCRHIVCFILRLLILLHQWSLSVMAYAVTLFHMIVIFSPFAIWNLPSFWHPADRLLTDAGRLWVDALAIWMNSSFHTVCVFF